MEERSINRGEVWWISVDDSIGGEQQTGRPALVLSTRGASNINNAYTVAYMTKGGFASPVMPSVIYGGVKHRVLCNQLRTLDESRFTKRITTLSNSDMSRINGALASALGLRAPTKQDEAEPDVEPESASEELAALRVDAAMYKRMYEKVLDQLVDLRIEMDMAKRVVAVEEEPPVVEAVEVVEEPEPEPEPLRIFQKEVELNSCTIEDLQSIGINEDTAIRLIEGRPYKKVEDVRTVDGVTSMLYSLLRQVAKVVVVEAPPVVAVEEPEVPEYTWDEFKKLSTSEQKEYLDYHRNELGESEGEIAERLGTKVQRLYNYTSKHPVLLRNKQIVVTEAPVSSNTPTPKVNVTRQMRVVEVPDGIMVNINTATAKEMSEKLGMPINDAYALTGFRSKNGLFGDIEEVLLVERFSEKKLAMYRNHICVADVVEEPPKPPVGNGITPTPVVKYDLNSASAYELQQAGFNKNQAHKIVGSRKRNGPFYEIEDLLKIDGIKKKDIRKLRDLLEV